MIMVSPEVQQPSLEYFDAIFVVDNFIFICKFFPRSRFMTLP